MSELKKCPALLAWTEQHGKGVNLAIETCPHRRPDPRVAELEMQLERHCFDCEMKRKSLHKTEVLRQIEAALFPGEERPIRDLEWQKDDIIEKIHRVEKLVEALKRMEGLDQRGHSRAVNCCQSLYDEAFEEARAALAEWEKEGK